jgi:hypothetical protein
MKLINTLLRRIKKSPKPRGGRGHTNETKVVRVPLNALDDLDSLIEDWREKAENGKGPRYHFLKQFLEEWDEATN